MLGDYIAQLRDRKTQKDRLRFRRNLERIGRIFGYEISKVLAYSAKEVRTPLATAQVLTCDSKVVIASILRAGIPVHNGLLDVFDDAENAFIAAYRKYDRDDDYHINIEYCTTPDIEGKVLILADSMIATGASIEAAYGKLLERGGEPAESHIVTPVVSVYAVEDLQKCLPEKATLWTAAIDEELTSKSFIIPGIGDAGDLAYGEKN